MYVLDALRVLARRWYVVLVGSVLVGAAAVSVATNVPPAYQASGQLLLLLPVTATGVHTPTNPYLNAPMGLTTTASLLAGNAATKDAQRSLVEAGFTADYSVSVVPGAGPLVVVSASGSDDADVVATRDEVMARLDAELASIQKAVQVPRGQFMFTSRSSVTRHAEVQPGSKLRALIGVTVAGGILVLGLVFGLDRLLQARRGRRGRVATRADAGPATPDPDPAPTDDLDPTPHRRDRVREAPRSMTSPARRPVSVRHLTPHNRTSLPTDAPTDTPTGSRADAPTGLPTDAPTAAPVEVPAMAVRDRASRVARS